MPNVDLAERIASSSTPGSVSRALARNECAGADSHQEPLSTHELTLRLWSGADLCHCFVSVKLTVVVAEASVEEQVTV
jgi:hypothetical protein